LRVIQGDTVISRALEVYGEWAQLEIDGIAPFLSPGDVVLDVGAFIGTHTLAFATFVGPTGRVVAFEPHKPIVAILEDNVRRSQFDNIQVLDFALGAVKASVDVPSLTLGKDSNFGAFSLRDPIEAQGEVEKIYVLPLDELSLDQVDFLKADVEGMEIEVLMGAEETIARCRPKIFVECNSLGNTVPVLEWCREHRYFPFGILAPAYNPNNYARNPDNHLFGDSSEVGVLLLPAERVDRYGKIIRESEFPQLRTFDDLALLLLHKAQYPVEVLAQTTTAALLGTGYPSPLSAKRNTEIALLRQQLAEREDRFASLLQSIFDHDAVIEVRNLQLVSLRQLIGKMETAAVREASKLSNLIQVASDRDIVFAEKESQLASIRQVLAEQQTIAAQQYLAIQGLIQSVSERDAALEHRKSRLAVLGQDLIERETTIAQQASGLATLIESISQRDAAIVQRDLRITVLEQLLAERQSFFAELEVRLNRFEQLDAERRETIAKQSAQLALQTQSMTELFSRVAESDAKVVDIAQTLLERDSQVSHLSRSLRERDAEFTEKVLRISGYESSRSWRMTRPFRYLTEFARSHRLNGHRGIGRTTSAMSADAKKNYSNAMELTIEKLKEDFDERYYLQRYPDVAAANIDPIAHYIEFGSAELRDPSPSFNTKYYLAANPDVKASGMNPLLHFVIAGRSEGRITRPPSDQGEILNACPYTIDQLKLEFNVPYYLQHYPDVANANLDPIAHYLEFGAAELRDPSHNFCTKYYLETNPDVKSAGINPFLHYVLNGRSEGRSGVHPGGYRARHLEQLQPLEQTVNLWRGSVSEMDRISLEALIEAFDWRFGPEVDSAVLSFSHDDYNTVVGGVQLCLLVEQTAYEERGVVYLSFHPAQPLPILASSIGVNELVLNIVCNGELLGRARVEDIVSVLRRFAGRIDFSIVVHALHGHAPEAIARIAQVAGVHEAVFWVHDYFSICPGYNLLRNGVAFCGAPPVTSPACGICVYGEERKSHLQRVRALFDAVEFVVASPSESALELWEARSNLPRKDVRVQPHCRIELSGDGPRASVPAGAPLRVAFLGYPVFFKGWLVFKGLLDEFSENSEFEFHYLGGWKPEDERLKVTTVTVNRENRTAMADAVAENQIDFVILWSLCPETFSFTTFEASAGGAYILTYRDSGNIAHVVSEGNLGRVFDNERDLFEFFRSGEAHQYVRERRRSSGAVGHLTFSRMTNDLIASERR